jgi:hypothetical protein
MSDKKNIKESSARPRDNWFWMRDSSGEASASLTFAAISFMVITGWMILSIFETVVLGEKTITTRPPPSEGIILAYLGTTFSLYFGRRYSVSKFSEGIAEVNESNRTTQRTATPPPIPSNNNSPRRNTQATYTIPDDNAGGE